MTGALSDVREVPPRRARIRKPWNASKILLAGTAGRVGLALLAITLLIVLIGPSVAPYSPYKIATGAPASTPSADHLLGTDLLGRDILSRFLYGGRAIILIPLIAVILSGSLGTFF